MNPAPERLVYISQKCQESTLALRSHPNHGLILVRGIFAATSWDADFGRCSSTCAAASPLARPNQGVPLFSAEDQSNSSVGMQSIQPQALPIVCEPPGSEIGDGDCCKPTSPSKKEHQQDLVLDRFDGIEAG